MTERRAKRLVGASLRPLLPLALIWVLGSILLAALIAQRAVPYEELVLDPNAYSGLPWYRGLVSSLGVLGWTAATVTAASGWWISHQGDRERAGQYLGGATLLSALLLFDDLFQLHVVVTRGVGLSKASFYGLYLGLGGWWMVRNRQEALRTRWPLLAAAGAALGSSVVVDQLVPASAPALVAEDSGKFLGILAWALYFALTARDIGASVLAAARSTPWPAAGQCPPFSGNGVVEPVPAGVGRDR